MADLEALFVAPGDSIRSVLSTIDRNSKGVALVVDPTRHLIDTVTDGDVRRAILARLDLDLPIQAVLERKPPMDHVGPLAAPAATSTADLLHMMNTSQIRHIPLIDADRRVVGIALLDELVKEHELPLSAVIMAGGFGARLRPLTDDVPKSMLPVGGQPLLALIVKQLREAGIRRLSLATHYKAEVIAEHFGDGSFFGVEIDYVQEESPLGTAGALRLLDVPSQPLLVINGDLLTNINFREMLNFHREHDADMTVAVCPYDTELPYGVVETDGARITGITEKPHLRHFINAGVYLLNPDVCAEIPRGSPYDMPDLIKRLVAQDRQVISFPVHERWADIGRMADYHAAVASARSDGS